MVRFLYLFSVFISLACLSENFTVKIPFKLPTQISKEEFQNSLNQIENNTVVISGAGPVGLLAAYVLAKKEYIKNILVLEI
ncbi:MAG: hypothetical protein KC505_01565 [Myxococcales bacterium]|nr:hypothetical protein [Myxococcales bacterium]